MTSNTDNTIPLSGIKNTPDNNYFESGSIKAVRKPLVMTQEELNSIVNEGIVYKSAAILAMRHGLLRIKEASA